MISKVKQVQGAGTFNSQHGELFKFEYTMEDGTILVANHKANKHFEVGAEVEYVVKTDNNFGKQGTVAKPQPLGQQSPTTSAQPTTKSTWVAPDQDAILYSVCLKESVNILRPTDTFIEIKPQAINDYAFELARVAKENIAKLK